MEKMNINIDKELDLLTAYIIDTKDYEYDHLEVVEGPLDGNVLFHINPSNNELVMIQIYDFSIIRRQMLKQLMVLLSKTALTYWLNTLIDSFKANKPKELYA